jgi:hypothetical protein
MTLLFMPRTLKTSPSLPWCMQCQGGCNRGAISCMLTEFDHHAHSDFTKLQLSQMFALQL